ncbi:hypothetical protein [Pseudomonas sp. AK106]
MRINMLATASMIALLTVASGCKEGKKEVRTADCSSPATAAEASKCLRKEDNITHSKPQTWSMDDEKK